MWLPTKCKVTYEAFISGVHYISVRECWPRMVPMSQVCRPPCYDTLHWPLCPCFPDPDPRSHLQSRCILSQCRDQYILSSVAPQTEQDFGPVLEHSIFVPRPWTKNKRIIQLIINMKQEETMDITPLKVVSNYSGKKSIPSLSNCIINSLKAGTVFGTPLAAFTSLPCTHQSHATLQELTNPRSIRVPRTHTAVTMEPAEEVTVKSLNSSDFSPGRD